MGRDRCEGSKLDVELELKTARCIDLRSAFLAKVGEVLVAIEHILLCCTINDQEDQFLKRINEF